MAPTITSLFGNSSFMLKNRLVRTKIGASEIDMGLACNIFLGRASELWKSGNLNGSNQNQFI